MTRKFRPAAASVMATTALALCLGGCKFDNRPLLAHNDAASPAYAGAAAPGPLDPAAYDNAGYAPAAQPGAPCACLQGAQAYAYPTRAYAASRAVHHRPPAYAFAYGGEQPWAWDAGDYGEMFAEPVGDDWAYYYYEPGDAYPYFVQYPDYSYAYGPDGALVALFTAAGVLLAADAYGPLEYRAHEYWQRGYQLDESYMRSPRYPVDPRAWSERGATVAAAQNRWFQRASAQPAWREAARAGWSEPRGAGRPLPGWTHSGGRQIAAAAPFAAAAGGAVAGHMMANHMANHIADRVTANRAAPQAFAQQGARVGFGHTAPTHLDRPRAFAQAERAQAMGHGASRREAAAQMRFAERGAAPHALAQARPSYAHAPARMAEPHAFARSASEHGAPAAFHAPAAPQFHGGGERAAHASAPHFGGGGGGPHGGGAPHAAQGGGGHGGGRDRHG